MLISTRGNLVALAQYPSAGSTVAINVENIHRICQRGSFLALLTHRRPSNPHLNTAHEHNFPFTLHNGDNNKARAKSHAHTDEWRWLEMKHDYITRTVLRASIRNKVVHLFFIIIILHLFSLLNLDFTSFYFFLLYNEIL